MRPGRRRRRLIAQGVDDNPIHNFAVPYSTAEVVRVFGDDIRDGDIFLHNDPYTGGTHLNDVLMLYPVFHDGRLAMFTATRCHWGDVGGMTPGSLSGQVQEIYQEGLRIVPTRICDRGRMNDAWLSLLFDNMRITRERRGDFNTMLGTSRKAAEHVGRLFARFGGGALLDAIEELIERAEKVMRARIAGIPDGTYHRRAISTATATVRIRCAVGSPSPSTVIASWPTSPAHRPRPGDRPTSDRRWRSTRWRAS